MIRAKIRPARPCILCGYKDGSDMILVGQLMFCSTCYENEFDLPYCTTTFEVDSLALERYKYWLKKLKEG